MPELSEVEYAELMRLKGVAEKINANPKAREIFQRSLAEALPDNLPPELRIRQEVDERFSGIRQEMNERVSSLEKKMTEAENAAQQKELTQLWLSGRAYARNAGFNDEGVKDLEEFMEREGISSHKHAIAAYEKERPTPPAPVTGNYGFDWFQPTPDTGGDEALKALLEGRDDEFLARTLPSAIAAGRSKT